MAWYKDKIGVGGSGQCNSPVRDSVTLGYSYFSLLAVWGLCSPSLSPALPGVLSSMCKDGEPESFVSV